MRVKNFKISSFKCKCQFTEFESIEQTSTEPSAEGTLQYINKRHSFKTLPDLAIYKPKKLEPNFAEVVLPKKSNLVVGCIYKHPCMDICTFNDHYLNLFLENLSKEVNKTIVLLGDFNIDLLNFATSKHVITFLDDPASNLLQSLLQHPVNITFENYLNTMNTLINPHVPLKKSTNYKESLNKNHRLLKKSKMQLKRKIGTFKNYIKCGDCNKNVLHQEYKTYRNSLSILPKHSKKIF